MDEEQIEEVGPLVVPEADPVTEPIDVHSVRVAVAHPVLPGPVPAPRASGAAAPWGESPTVRSVRRRLVEIDRMDAA
jgi:hypothetical protein